MLNNNTKAIWAIILTAILWGVSFVSIKVTVAFMGPITLTLYRFVIATVVLFLMIKLTKGTFKIQKKDIPKFVGSGFIGMVIYFYLQNSGINYITASEASIIVASVPIVSLLMESLITKTKITPLKSLIVLVSFIGVFIMIGVSNQGLNSGNRTLGYVLIFLSIISWVLYGMSSRPLSNKYPQMTIVFYQSLFSTVFLFVLSFLEPSRDIVWSNILVLNVLYLAVICSAFTFYLYNYAIKHLGVSSTNVYLNLIPIVTVTTSTILLNERIQLNQILGGALVLFSVGYLSWNEKKAAMQLSKLESITMESN